MSDIFQNMSDIFFEGKPCLSRATKLEHFCRKRTEHKHYRTHMADIIHLLPDSVANQIAAGEVIQRPASVIKELVENSLDAKATQIDVIVIDAGKTSIHVVDNGCGMSPEDARTAFLRHATSKLRCAEDLAAIGTMGFRGEALAAIASVSSRPVCGAWSQSFSISCHSACVRSILFTVSPSCCLRL